MSKTTVVILALILWVVGIAVTEDRTTLLFSVYLPPVAWWNALVAILQGLLLLF